MYFGSHEWLVSLCVIAATSQQRMATLWQKFIVDGISINTDSLEGPRYR